jgi:hypothetical protein
MATESWLTETAEGGLDSIKISGSSGGKDNCYGDNHLLWRTEIQEGQSGILQDFAGVCCILLNGIINMTLLFLDRETLLAAERERIRQEELQRVEAELRRKEEEEKRLIREKEELLRQKEVCCVFFTLKIAGCILGVFKAKSLLRIRYGTRAL